LEKLRVDALASYGKKTEAETDVALIAKAKRPRSKLFEIMVTDTSNLEE
jgi:hypothetical protein